MLLLSALCKLDFSTLHSSPDKEEETIDAVTKPTDFKTVTGWADLIFYSKLLFNAGLW